MPHPNFHSSGAACLRTASPILVLALALAVAMAVTDPLAAQELLFSDDFNSTQIDPNRWKVSLPFSNTPASTVQESGGSVELFRRGILDATIANLPAEIDLEGRFRFTGESDTLSIVFRSDHTVTDHAERRGVQAALQQGTGRVYLIPEPFATVPISGTYLLGKDTNVTFRLTDNGETVRLYLQDFFTPVLTATITNRRSNRLSRCRGIRCEQRDSHDASSRSVERPAGGHGDRGFGRTHPETSPDSRRDAERRSGHDGESPRASILGCTQVATLSVHLPQVDAGVPLYPPKILFTIISCPR